jgi:hypothetical protein
MSLIDEALKRAELEAARRDGLRGGAYPWVPEHMPRRRSPWGWIAATVAGLGLAVAGAVWLIGRPAPVQGPAAVQGPKSNVQGSPRPMLDTVVEVSPPPVGLPSRGATPAKNDDANAKAGKETQRPTPPFDTARARIAPAPGAASGAAENKPPRGLADGRTYAGEVTLPDGPKIELEGIVFSEANPVALINGKVLPPGGVVEEFTIVSIKSDRVELTGHGVTIFLTLK